MAAELLTGQGDLNRAQDELKHGLSQLEKSAESAMKAALEEATKLQKGQLRLELFRTGYIGGFLPDLEGAYQTINALLSGKLTTADLDLTTYFGQQSEQDIINYLRKFSLPNGQDKGLYMSLYPTFELGGKELVHQRFGFAPLSEYSFSPSFSADHTVPCLIDPKEYSIAEFSTLEALDPSHAADILAGWQQIKSSVGDQSVMKDPKIIRMCAFVPVSSNYSTNILPRLSFPKDMSQSEAWMPRLIINGTVNESGPTLRKQLSFDTNSIPMANPDGKIAALKVDKQTIIDPMANVEAGEGRTVDTLAVVLLPNRIVKKPKPPTRAYNIGDQFNDNLTYKGVSPTRSIGSAGFTDGNAGWQNSGQSSQTYDEFIVPDENRQPVIYSIRVFTVA